jgi:hypothetical protein
MHRKGVSYGLNWTGVQGFTCLLSRKVVVAVDQNVDMIFIMLA